MSYDIHEAYCLDSFSTQLNFWDDFEGDSLKDLWRSTGDVGGSAVVVDAQDGGVVRLTTNNATLEGWRLDWTNIRSLHIDKKVTMEVRIKLTHVEWMVQRLRLYFDAQNYVGFSVVGGVATGDYTIQSEDDNIFGEAASGVTSDTDYHIFRIECFPTGEVHFYIDGVETANSPLTANIPDGAADYLQPYLLIQTREDVAKTMDIDYVYIRQNRT